MKVERQSRIEHLETSLWNQGEISIAITIRIKPWLSARCGGASGARRVCIASSCSLILGAEVLPNA